MMKGSSYYVSTCRSIKKAERYLTFDSLGISLDKKVRRAHSTYHFHVYILSDIFSSQIYINMPSCQSMSVSLFIRNVLLFLQIRKFCEILKIK